MIAQDAGVILLIYKYIQIHLTAGRQNFVIIDNIMTGQQAEPLKNLDLCHYRAENAANLQFRVI